MTDCGCRNTEIDQDDNRKTLQIALCLNATMFIVGIVAGVVGQSSGLIADSLDMLADASAYAIALLATKRSDFFKIRAATSSGGILLILGFGVVLDAARRGLHGSSPRGGVMMAVATVSLLVNSTVLYLLAKEKDTHEVHIRATYIFTRADVVANIGVILSGVILIFTGFRYVDLIAGCAIGSYVIKEAVEILREARTVSQTRSSMR